MPKVLPFIEYVKEDKNPIIDSPNAFYKLLMYKTEEYFNNPESHVNFIKKVEHCVRTNDRYNKYIAYIKNEVKLDRCAVFKDINDDDATIEMHHGILDLFNICDVVTQYFLLHKWKISTFIIADEVLSEHWKNHIPIVMVSTTVHQEIHAGNIFIPYQSFFGDFKAFIKKYNDAMSTEIKTIINRYIDKSLMKDSTDLSILDLNPELKGGN